MGCSDGYTRQMRFRKGRAAARRGQGRMNEIELEENCG